MEIEIYADVLFFINFFMDFIILFLTNKITEMKKSVKVLIAYSVIMALIYCIFSVGFWRMYGCIFQPLLMLLMVFFTFKPPNLYTYFRVLIVNIVVSFAVGGINFVMYFYNAYDYIIKGNSANIFPFSLLISGTSMAVVIILLFKVYINNKIMKTQKICKLQLYFHNQKVELMALVDTGHNLQDPITGKSVIIVDKNIAVRLINNTKINGIRLLPYKSLGNHNGMLRGITIDKAVIENREIERPIIGIYNESLNMEGLFNGLISPKILNGG